tara:strand:+ start:343 stop:573 length:231 start_codon:yes stop_codon:yes gene_type:complete
MGVFLLSLHRKYRSVLSAGNMVVRHRCGSGICRVVYRVKWLNIDMCKMDGTTKFWRWFKRLNALILGAIGAQLATL